MRLLHVDPTHPEERLVRLAAAFIQEGRLVAFPTETVYGLGANAFDAAAVTGIYLAKGRPTSDPCIVHIASRDMLPLLARRHIPEVDALAEAFWPGPLSIVVPKSERVPGIVTADQETVAIRMPNHPVALALIAAAGLPIAAPSANRFMHTSPTTADHVIEDLGDRVDLVLDAGPASIGVESTVLDVSGLIPTLLRPGAIGIEALRRVLGRVDMRPHDAGPSVASPGLLSKHYATAADLFLFRGPSAERVLAAMRAEAAQLTGRRRRVGLLLADEDTWPDQEGFHIVRPGSVQKLDDVARHLFSSLRQLEAGRVDVILARGYPIAGIGLAIQDRLTRAAGGKVIEVP